MTRFTQLVRPIVAAGLLAVIPHLSSAQLPIPSFSLAGGVSHYHLPSSGSTPFGAIRIDIPLLSFVADGSLGVFRPTDQVGVQRTVVIPEAQLQMQLLPVLVRPYVGIGGGWFRAVSGPGTHTNELTGSASAGVRVGIPLTGFGLRAEVRTRGVGSHFRDGGATEWTLGASW